MKRENRLLRLIREGGELTRGQKLKLIAQLSVPSILAQITTTMMFFIDAAMVGTLGAHGSAAIGLVESTTWLFSSLTSAAAMGFSVQVAHFIGANDVSRARRVFRQGIIATFAFAFLLFLVAAIIARPLPHWLGGGTDIAADASYYFLIFSATLPIWQIGTLASSMLKCAGDMRTPSMLSILSCLLDVAFNYLLIFPTRTVSLFGADFTMPGAGLGVVGAALGTALSLVITSVLLLWQAAFRSPLLKIFGGEKETLPQQPDSRLSIVRQAFKISTPMGAQQIMMGGAQVVSTMIVAPLGTVAIAAHSLAITAESLCYMPGYGIGEAATTLTGQTLGAGKKPMARSFARLSIAMGMLVMALMGAVMFCFAPEMMGFLTPVEEIRQLGINVLRIEAFAEPFFAAAIVSYAVCVGAGDTLVPASMTLASMWLVRLTLAALLAPRWGLPGVWTAMAIELTFRGIILLCRIASGRWMRKKIV